MNYAEMAYDTVRNFELALADYTGAPYAVAVDSCTAALHLCCEYKQVGEVEIPRRTYVGVGMSVLNAGGRVTFRDQEWSGDYRLEPFLIVDSAKRFTSGMYLPGRFTCVSFHWSKILGIGRGGAILTDSSSAVVWLRRARFDGRRTGVTAGLDNPKTPGFHYYMTPELAAAGLMRLFLLPKHNPDQPCDDYPDLSKMEVFK